MKGKNKAIILIMIIYVSVVLGIVIINLVEPLLYNKFTSGEKTTSNDIYDVAHSIVAMKYRIILYENIEELDKIFSYNCKSKLKNMANSDIENELLDEFSSFQITNIEEKDNDKYIIYYNEQFQNNNINENKMIIKYRKNKAIIYYDSILEAAYE